MNKHIVKNPWGLTHSEVDVMDRLVALGCQKEVAHSLRLKQSSVSTFTQRARTKMNAPNTIKAAFAWRDWRNGAGKGVPA